VFDQAAGVRDVAIDARAGRVFVHSMNGAGPQARLYILDMATGAQEQTLDLGRGYATALLAAPRSGHVFLATTATAFGAPAGYVSMFDARRGRFLRAIPVDTKTNTLGLRLAVDDLHDRVFVARAGLPFGQHPIGGDVSVLDALTGRVARRFRVPGMVTAVAVDSRANRVLVVSDGQPQSQQHAWTIGLFDAASGRLLHSLPVPLQPDPTSIVVDERAGHAFILGAAYRGALYVVDTHTGRLVRTIRFGTMPTALAVDEAKGRVFVALPGPTVKRSAYAATSVYSGVGFENWLPSGNGYVRVLDATTGMVIVKGIPVGVAPVALAVDARRGRVLALNAGARDEYMLDSGHVLHLRAPSTAPSSISVLDAARARVTRTIGLDTRMAPQSLALDVASGRAFVAVDGGVAGVSVADPLAWLPSVLRRRLPAPRPATRTVSGSVVIVDTAR